MHLETFIGDVSNVDEFENKLSMLRLMLRRIELNLPDTQMNEALEFIISRQISPFCVSTVLYSHISIYVERENIMLGIASAFLDKGDVANAFLTLSLIQNPSEEAKNLLNEFQ